MLPIALLVFAFLFLLLALLAFWQSVRALFGRGVDEISAAIGGDRAALVDEKNSLLTALKDLEFERAVGKVSDADWKRLDASYRARAKDVLAELDRDLGPWREKAEKLVQQRLGHRKPAKSAASAAAKAPEAEKVAAKVAPEVAKVAPEVAKVAPEAAKVAPEAAKVTPEAAKVEQTEPPTCPSCGAGNDADAVFCKKCAARLASNTPQEAS